MKKISIIAITMLIFLNLNCTDSSDQRSRYFEAYKKILFVREKTTDSTKANREVAEILKQFNFTEKQFWQISRDLFESDRKEYLRILDSLREWSRKESQKE